MSKEEKEIGLKEEKKTKKNWVLRFLLFLFILILLLPLILHIGFVQNFLADSFAKRISKKTNSEIRIDNVGFSVFKGLTLENLYISDPGYSNDTLAIIGAFSTSLKQNILSILKNRVYLNEINLSDTKLNIITQQGDSISNFDRFLKSLTSEPTTSNSDSEPLSLELSHLNFKNLSYNNQDLNTGAHSVVKLGEGHVGIETIDLENDSILINHLSLNRPSFKIIKGESKEKADKSEELEEKVENDKAKDQFIKIANVEIHDGSFLIKDSLNYIGNASGLDLSNLSIDSFHLVGNNLEFHSPLNVKAHIEQMSFVEANGFTLNNFEVEDLVFNDHITKLEGLRLETNKSVIKDHIQFDYKSFDDFSNFEEAIWIQADMTGSQIAFEDLTYFFPDLKSSPFFSLNGNRKFRITGLVEGTVDDLEAENMFLSIDNLIELSGSLSTYELSNSSSALINLYVDELSTTLVNLKKVIPGFRPPDQFYKLDPISFTGDIEGFFDDFVIYGFLQSSLGKVNLDTRLDTRGGINEASYSGEIALQDFDLRTWTGNDQLGYATLSASIQDGQGLTLETVKTDLSAELNRFDFKGYTYSNVSLNGILEKNLFDGQFAIDDPNAQMEFDGQINISEQYIKSDFKAAIDKIDLVALNLSKDYSNIHGNFDLSIEGSSITDFIGLADVKNLDLVYKGKDFKFGQLYLSSAPGANESRNLLITSDIFNATIDGKFDFAEVGSAFSNYIYDNHPGWAQKLEIYSKKSGLKNNQDFSYKIEIFDTKDYLELANISDLRFQNLKIFGESKLNESRFDLNITVDSSYYKDYKISDVSVALINNKRFSKFLLGLEKIQTNGKFYEPLEIKTDVDGDLVNVNIKTANVLDSIGSIDVKIRILPEGDNIVFNLENQNLQMFSSDWEIDERNKIILGDKFIDIDDFVLSDGYRSIFVKDYNNKGIELDLSNFDFLLINGIIDYDKIDFAGEGTVFTRIANIYDKPQIVADVQIPEFTLNGVDYGGLSARLDDDNGKSLATISLNREEDNMFLIVDAELDKNSNALNGSVKARKLPMNTFEFIIDDGISDTGGAADLDAVVSGTMDDIKIDGRANVVSGQTRIDYLNTLIGLGGEEFTFNEKFIDLTDVTLSDRLGNNAVMTGGINHDLFGDFSTDLNMRADRFLALDTDKLDNPLYYGIGIGEMSIDYFGPFSSTDITINAITGPGTVLNIPIEDSYTDVDKNIVTFYNREDIKRKREEVVVTETIKLEGVDVEMNLTMTEDAEVNMIFDERQNDVITGRGNGDMRITISREGDFNIYGEYIVESGDYLFTAWNFVAKPFQVKRGGQIVWTGDPVNANLNIEATYDDLRAPVNILLAEYLVGNVNLEQEAKQRTSIDLTLKVGGTLYKPTVNFDIGFPELQGELRTYTDSKMRTLRQNEAELNEQVAGLIMFRSFLPSNSLGNVFTTSNSFVETTYNTLSEFVSNQLSYLLSGFFQEALTENGFVSGIDFEIGFSKNSNLLENVPQSDNYLPDEIEVHFKPRFQNDKWGFDYGTSFVNTTNSATVQANYVIHDFVLEYYLTADRRLKLRAYGKWDKDEVSFGNEQKYGLGINYRKEFGSITKFKEALKEDLSTLKKNEEGEEGQ